jgi:hypothetical protein
MKAVLLGTLLWASAAFAEDTPLDLMSSCVTTGDRQVFSLYREPSDHGVGFLYNYHEGELVEHKVDIQYTNAGARAIVTSEDLPMLILIGTGKSIIPWNGSTWNCQSRF